MPDEPVPARARKLYRAGRPDRALALLEPQIFRYREDPEFYRLLSAACFDVGDWNGARTYLERLDQFFSGEDLDVRLALAACQARSGDWTSALSSWLAVLELRPGSRVAKRGLEGLRKAMASDRANTWTRSKKFQRCLPVLVRKGIPPGYLKSLLVFGVVACLATGAGAGWLFVSSTSPNRQSAPLVPEQTGQQTPNRPGLDDSSLGTLPVVQDGGTWSITLTEDQARKAWRDAQNYFQNYRDSLARREINRILLSNASQELKQKARGLIPFLKNPDFTSFHDEVSYAVVRQNPDLYEGCAVRWEGVIANLVSGKTEIDFDLLLGYQNAQVIEGIVPVRLKFAALLHNSQVVDVLGLIDKNASGNWRLSGVALHEIGYKTP